MQKRDCQQDFYGFFQSLNFLSLLHWNALSQHLALILVGCVIYRVLYCKIQLENLLASTWRKGGCKPCEFFLSSEACELYTVKFDEIQTDLEMLMNLDELLAGTCTNIHHRSKI